MGRDEGRNKRQETYRLVEQSRALEALDLAGGGGGGGGGGTSGGGSRSDGLALGDGTGTGGGGSLEGVHDVLGPCCPVPCE